MKYEYNHILGEEKRLDITATTRHDTIVLPCDRQRYRDLFPALFKHIYKFFRKVNDLVIKKLIRIMIKKSRR